MDILLQYKQWIETKSKSLVMGGVLVFITVVFIMALFIGLSISTHFTLHDNVEEIAERLTIITTGK